MFLSPMEMSILKNLHALNIVNYIGLFFKRFYFEVILALQKIFKIAQKMSINILILYNYNANQRTGN